MEEIFNAGIAALRDALRKGELSAVEATRGYLERIDQHSELNCFITVSEEAAMQHAEQADERLGKGEDAPLLGIPVAVKDLILTEGIRTTCASKMLDNYIPPYGATVVRKLRDAGAVLIGKTNMDQFGMGSSTENSFYGPVLNPYCKERVAGGSSGGSAAAVAAGLVPGALGTDTGGSIRQPASFCGVVGLKPTYGRVSRYGVVAYASSLDQVGSFAANCADCALLTEIIAGHDPLDATSVERSAPLLSDLGGSSVRGLRIGMPEEFFGEGLAPEVANLLQQALQIFASLGAEIVKVKLPHSDLAIACYYILAPAEASSNLSRFDGVKYGYRAGDCLDLHQMYGRTRAEGFGAEVKRRIMIGTYVLSSGYYDAYYRRAQQVRRLIMQDFEAAFADCDVIAAPTAPTTAFRINEKVEDPLEMYLSDIFTVPVNLAGLPGMSVPCGKDSQGLPVGLQLIGKAWDEMTLLRTAHCFEESGDWRERRAHGI